MGLLVPGGNASKIRSIPPLPKARPGRSVLGNYPGVWVLALVTGTGDGSITPWEGEVEAEGKMGKRSERRLDSWGPALKSLTFNSNRVAYPRIKASKSNMLCLPWSSRELLEDSRGVMSSVGDTR